jgi:hypothetical protein
MFHPTGLSTVARLFQMRLHPILCSLRRSRLPILFLIVATSPFIDLCLFIARPPCHFMPSLRYRSLSADQKMRTDLPILPWACLPFLIDPLRRQLRKQPLLGTPIQIRIKLYRIGDRFDSFRHSLDFFLDLPRQFLICQLARFT